MKLHPLPGGGLESPVGRSEDAKVVWLVGKGFAWGCADAVTFNVAAEFSGFVGGVRAKRTANTCSLVGQVSEGCSGLFANCRNV